MSLFYHLLDADILNSEGTMTADHVLLLCYRNISFLEVTFFSRFIDSYHIMMAELLAWAVAEVI